MAVTANFYKTTDDPRVIGKSLENIKTNVSCSIYNQSSITSPAILLKYDADIFGGANYCVLGAPFNRAYFMSPPQTLDGGRMVIPLDIDVRETYKLGIGNLTPIVTRSEDLNYGMIVDDKVSATANYSVYYQPTEEGDVFISGHAWHIVLEVIGT